MKKLLFATAVAASAAAFAEVQLPNAVGFENANDYNPNEAGSCFYFAGDSDSSSVTNVGVGNTFTDKRTAYFAGLSTPAPANESYLMLDTEGGTLWRSIDEIGTTDGYSLGTAQSVAATGTYLDTLVQFTVTEDEAPEVGEGDKLAIWLQAGEGTTNLMVKAAVVDDLGGTTATTFTLDSAVEPGNWYRLTVKAIVDITDGEKIPGFQIYIDGVLATSTTSTLTAGYLEILDEDSHYADLVAGKYFASLVKMNALTLQGVGFQGTGAVDEIVWTEENPFPAVNTVDFTLTWDANVTAVSYTIDGDTTPISDLSTFTNVVAVAPGTTVTVAATPAAWYTVSGTGDVTVNAAMTQDITTALAATPGDAGATGLPATITTAAAKAWADAKSLTPDQIAACSFADKAYLLNTDLTAEPELKITSIEETTGGWNITVKAFKTVSETEQGITLEGINGSLKVKTAATLAGLESATSATYNMTFDANGVATITVTGDNKNFMKATVE